MIKFLVILIASISLVNCSAETEINLVHLNGYWEIDHVVSKTNDKKYNFNQMIEYFKTEDSIGFRTKLQPNFTGKYTGSKQKINYVISKKLDKYVITYKNAFSTWNDFLIESSPEQICIENNEGTRYYYRKFTPIQLNEEN